MKKILNKKGFTLQELVVVVFLMGLLLVVGIPAYDGLKTRSENKACASNIEILQLAVVEYYNSNQVAPTNTDDLRPFIDDESQLYCPNSVDGVKKYYYGIAAVKNADGSYTGKVICPCGDEGHAPEGEVESFSEYNNYVLLQEAKTVDIR